MTDALGTAADDAAWATEDTAGWADAAAEDTGAPESMAAKELDGTAADLRGPACAAAAAGLGDRFRVDAAGATVAFALSAAAVRRLPRTGLPARLSPARPDAAGETPFPAVAAGPGASASGESAFATACGPANDNPSAKAAAPIRNPTFGSDMVVLRIS
ncbi:MAG: hypothetical protein KIH64_017400 [Mycobacterium sp.]|nr:hypothetical protein [Mycobacterium sp.]